MVPCLSEQSYAIRKESGIPTGSLIISQKIKASAENLRIQLVSEISAEKLLLPLRAPLGFPSKSLGT